MRASAAGAFLALNLLACSTIASAASLQVSPVNIEVQAPGAASTVTLQNLGTATVNAQVRIFKWSQTNGNDELVPTRDVVASPPAVKMVAGKKSVIRILRLSKTPLSAEEDYRLIVDEIPEAMAPGVTGVNFNVQYSIPVFFTKPGFASDIGWTARVSNGKFRLSAQNYGDRRVQISALKVIGKSGGTINFGDGLVGYVLGHASREWVVKAGSKAIAAGATVKITALGDNGPIEATAKVVAAN